MDRRVADVSDPEVAAEARRRVANVAASRIVTIQFLKYPETPHWRFSGEHLGTDEWGTWIGGRAGGSARRGYEEPITFEHPWVKLVPARSWWTAIWNEGGKYAGYVDIIAPPVWDGDIVRMVDLDLDVAMYRDGRTAVLDEDEFAEHVVALGYPPRLVDGARGATARVVTAIEAGREPFGSVARRRLADWVAATS